MPHVCIGFYSGWAFLGIMPTILCGVPIERTPGKHVSVNWQPQYN